jgi:hypothetical protein
MPDEELEILTATKEKARQRMEEDPSAANIEAYSKASKLLTDYLTGGKEPAVENRLEAVGWLKSKGYKIGKSKLYQDVKSGKLPMAADGSILESDLKRYAKKLPQPDMMAADAATSELLRKNKEIENEKLREQVRQLKYKNEILEGTYIERARVETEQAIKAAALRAGLKQLYEAHFRECVELVRGELSLTRQAINFWAEKTDELLDAFARMDEIEVRLKLAN